MVRCWPCGCLLRTGPQWKWGTRCVFWANDSGPVHRVQLRKNYPVPHSIQHSVDTWYSACILVLYFRSYRCGGISISHARIFHAELTDQTRLTRTFSRNREREHPLALILSHTHSANVTALHSHTKHKQTVPQNTHTTVSYSVSLRHPSSARFFLRSTTRVAQLGCGTDK